MNWIYIFFPEFYVEIKENCECSLICIMRCELGDQNDSYYLCADAQDSKVFLLVSVEQ